MNIQSRLSALKSQKRVTERELRDAQWDYAANKEDPERTRVVRERREADQLLADQIAGLEEGQRIESEKNAEQARRVDQEKRHSAVTDGRRFNQERRKLDQRQARLLRELIENNELKKSLGHELLKTIRPHLPLPEFIALKDAAVFPTMAPDDEIIVRELAAGGIAIPGIQQVQATTFVQQRGYLRRAEDRAKQVQRALEEMLQDEEDG